MFTTFSAILLLLASPLLGGIDDDWFDPAFIEANTLKAGTGFILVPSPEVIPAGVISASIHRYHIKLDYGLWDIFELGITADMDGYLLTEAYHNQIFYARARILSYEKNGVGLSLGVDGLGLEDFGLPAKPSPLLEKLEELYVVAGLPLPFYPSLMVSAGWGSGAMPAHGFFNVSKVVIPGLLLMGEHDGFGVNLGARFLFSPRIKLDLSAVHTQEIQSNKMDQILKNNMWFGITYSEPWDLTLASLLPSGKKNAPKADTKKP